MRTGNVPISDKSSANKDTRRSGEAFSLDQLAHSLVPAGTQLVLDRTEIRHLDALFNNKEPIIAQYGPDRRAGR